MLKNTVNEEEQKRYYYIYIKILNDCINTFYVKQYFECYKVTNLILLRKL